MLVMEDCLKQQLTSPFSVLIYAVRRVGASVAEDKLIAGRDTRLQLQLTVALHAKRCVSRHLNRPNAASVVI